MKVLLFGATGMVGQGVLHECLLDPGVDMVVAIGRSATGKSDPKLGEIIHTDLTSYSAIESKLTGFDACFFCLGVSSASMSLEEYTRITYDITLSAAETLVRLNPGMTFVYVSGQGTDTTEQGRFMWARIKGRTENALLRLPFKAAFMFRPGFIAPRFGAQSRTPLYRILYVAAGPLIPLLRRAFRNHFLGTDEIGQAMLIVARAGAPERVLESADIRALLDSWKQIAPRTKPPSDVPLQDRD